MTLIRKIAASIVVLSLLTTIAPSVLALELERPHDTYVINHRADNATTNGEVTAGVGTYLEIYQENGEMRGDNAELHITGTANSRQIIRYVCEEDEYHWHDVTGDMEFEDNSVARIGLAYPVRFYGGRGGSFEYDYIWICSNGWVSFYDPTKTQPSADARIIIPYEGQANAVVAPFSRDLKPNLGGAIRYGYVYHESSSFLNPRLCFCVSWEDVPDETGNLQSFQVLLEQEIDFMQQKPRQNFIWFQYKQITKDKLTTVGIEDQQGGKYTAYNYQNLGNARTLVFRVDSKSAEIESITIRLVKNDAYANTDIVVDPQWVGGYNVILETTLPPENASAFAVALEGIPALCIEAFLLVAENPPLWVEAGGLALGPIFLVKELSDMGAEAMAQAKLLDTDSQKFAHAHADGPVTDVSLGIVAFWKFTDDTHLFDHSLRIEVEVNYLKRNSYYGDITDYGLSHKTYVDLKFVNKDNNDSTDTAETINPFIWYEWRYLSSKDKEDFYKIWVKQNQRLYVMMCPPLKGEFSADFDLYLIDKNNVIQGSSTNTAGVVEEASVVSAYEGYWYIKIVQVNNYGYYKMTASVENTGGGGGCPILSVFNGFAFAVEGLLDIHNPNYTDVVREHVLDTEPQPVNYTYLLRLTEHPQTHSYIDQVKLYAMLENNMTIRLPLISAIHSEHGNVLPQLLLSDDTRTDTEARQTITLKFLALPPWINIEDFIFVIEGHNPSYKE